MSGDRYKPRGRVGMFDKEYNLRKLKKLCDPLERLAKVIDFEMFREELESNMLNAERKNNSGCKPYDIVMMLKIIMIKRFYNLSDEQAEFQINDRASFKEFLGLSSGDGVPDARTIWLFQDKLIKRGIDEKLFDKFHKYLDSIGILVNLGKVVDVTIVEVPCQRNRREENEKIKLGEGEELWKEELCKKRQKDIEARWTVKRGKRSFGYKNHIKIDGSSKLIDTYEVTSAEVLDSQGIERLLREEDKGQEIYADSAYIGQGIEELLKERGIISQIIERRYRGKQLTEEQKGSNRRKSKIRCRVEHVFGFVKNSMKGFYIRSIGYQRVKGVIGLTNLVYNICRYEQIVRLNLLQAK